MSRSEYVPLSSRSRGRRISISYDPTLPLRLHYPPRYSSSSTYGSHSSSSSPEPPRAPQPPPYQSTVDLPPRSPHHNTSRTYVDAFYHRTCIATLPLNSVVRWMPASIGSLQKKKNNGRSRSPTGEGWAAEFGPHGRWSEEKVAEDGVGARLDLSLLVPDRSGTVLKATMRELEGDARRAGSLDNTEQWGEKRVPGVWEYLDCRRRVKFWRAVEKVLEVAAALGMPIRAENLGPVGAVVVEFLVTLGIREEVPGVDEAAERVLSNLPLEPATANLLRNYGFPIPMPASLRSPSPTPQSEAQPEFKPSPKPIPQIHLSPPTPTVEPSPLSPSPSRTPSPSPSPSPVPSYTPQTQTRKRPAIFLLHPISNIKKFISSAKGPKTEIAGFSEILEIMEVAARSAPVGVEVRFMDDAVEGRGEEWGGRGWGWGWDEVEKVKHEEQGSWGEWKFRGFGEMG